MLIAHVSDAHVRVAIPDQSNGINPNASLVSAICELNALEPRPSIVLMTGDFTNSDTPGEYEELKSILEKLEFRFLIIPGNHDNRTIMRAVIVNLALSAEIDPSSPIPKNLGLDV